MTTEGKPVDDTSNRELVQSRLLDAPQEMVFEVWTNPEHIIHWWGPNGFTNTIHEMEVRPGGVWRFIMHGPDGTNYPNKIVYIEVVKPERLVYTHGGDEEQVDFYVTVTFEKRGKKTLLTMTALFPSAVELERVVKEHGAKEGGVQTLNRLAEYLVKMS